MLEKNALSAYMWLYFATLEEINILKNYFRRKEKKSKKENGAIGK